MLVNLFRANALHGMSYEFAHEIQKACHMRQLGMRVEGSLVYPFGVNVENQGIPQRFVEMNANAAGLGARRFEEQFQFFAQLIFFPRDWFEANKSVQRQGEPPAEYSLRLADENAARNLVLCDCGGRGSLSGDSMR